MMNAEQTAQRRFPLNAVRICIDAISNHDYSGRIYSEMLREPLIFHNCFEMFLLTDRLFDDRGFPQAFQTKRSFRKTPPSCGYRPRQEVYPEEVNIAEQKGICETCDVIVQTRKRTGWQGLVKDSKTQKPIKFQSEMELLDYLLQNYTTFPAA